MTPTQNTTNTTTPKSTIIIVIVVILAAVFLLPRLFNNNTATTPQTVPAQQNPQTNNTNDNIQLGAPVSASGVDSNGCATNSESTFSPNDNIYVVAPESNIPQGTSVYARLYLNNTAIEDTSAITADRNYVDNCINFVFEPSGGNFAAGNYEAQFFVNGNAGPSVVFNVQ